MYKAIVELGRINRSMRLKFGLILKDDPQNIYKQKKTVDKFTYSGNEYLSVNPSSFLTIDISASDDKNSAWNTNNSVNFTKDKLFILGNSLKRIISKFNEPDLFYIKDKHLYVNKELSDKYEQVVNTYSKKVMIKHVVVLDDNDPNVQYEGVVFMINSPDYFCCLTYDELTYLYHEITKIDLSLLSMEVINLYINIESLGNKIETKDYTMKSMNFSNKSMVEKVSAEDNGTSLSPPKEANTIPNI